MSAAKKARHETTPVVVQYKEPKIMAEIGCNHMGSVEIAKELLTLAKQAGCHYGKFQKRNPKELLTKAQYEAPHPNPRNSYGDTYGAHREFLELTVDQHRELKDHCDQIGLGYSCSVWDTTSAKEIVSLNPDLIKVGSPSNQHWEMQKVLRDEYTGDVHISTGMTTKEEIEKIVTFWEEGKGDAKNRLILYNCTSGYPVPFEDVCMLELRTLVDLYSHRVQAIGFSGHHLGIAIDVAAYAMGATWNERHFTKDRTWKGTDHAASLEPPGMTKLCRDLKNTYKCMTYKQTDILPIEAEQRAKLKWGQYNAAKVHGIPKFREFLSMDGAREYLEELGEGNYVVKADGLCGGKGVKVAGDHLSSIDEALAYCEECLPHFVLCERLRGEEFSVLSFTDGETLSHMPAVQDHKRAYEGDQGPNTGGMGTYTCEDHLLPFLSQKALDEARAINGACVRALRCELGELYRGILYGGYMLTPKGVMLIEFNARFGDPECINLLALLDHKRTDFLTVCEATASGGLARVPVHFQPLASCCKYACPEGYPDTPLKGFEVDLSGLESPEFAFLGAIDRDAAGTLRGTGSRTVGVVALAADLNAAEARAEREVSAVKGSLFHRSDIGKEPLVASRVKRMLELQAAAAADGAPGGRVVRLGVLGSTRGSSLQPVLRALAAGVLRHVTIILVLSNKKDAGILRRAALHGLPHAHVPVNGRSRDAYDAEITQRLEESGCDAVLCVGWMRILSAPFCMRWRQRALNVHPSLLPAFAGGMDLEVHSAVLAAGVPESGCTVHFIEEAVDGGQIVVQKRCPVLPLDTPESLKARVQPLEGVAFLEAIGIVAAQVRAAAFSDPPALS